MNSRPNETEWAQKYRPSKLEDMVLPETWKQKLITLRDAQTGLSLLLHGPAGTGKTTVGMLFNDENTYKVNCSVRNGVQMVREVAEMSCRASLIDGVRVILLDEADSLTNEAQAGLRGVMEEYSFMNMYIFTTNHANNLIPPLHSRTMPLDFSQLKGDPILREQMLSRVLEILRVENHEIDSQRVRSLVQLHFPDMRQILKRLQFDVA